MYLINSSEHGLLLGRMEVSALPYLLGPITISPFAVGCLEQSALCDFSIIISTWRSD